MMWKKEMLNGFNMLKLQTKGDVARFGLLKQARVAHASTVGSEAAGTKRESW